MNSGISRILNWIIVLVGIVQVISPFFLGITVFPAVISGIIVGILLIVLGVAAAVSHRDSSARTLDVIIAILGAWLIVAPFLFGYAHLTNGVLRSPILIGIIVLVLAVLAALSNRREVYHTEPGAAVYGRGSSPDTEIRVPSTHAETEISKADQAAPSQSAPAATAEPEKRSQARDYQAADTPTRGETKEQKQANGGAAEEQSHPSSSFRGVGPEGYQRSDERILEDIVARLTEDERLDASRVRVSVQNGDVVLSGTVPSGGDTRLAEDLTETVPGVRKVHNDLHIGKDAES